MFFYDQSRNAKLLPTTINAKGGANLAIIEVHVSSGRVFIRRQSVNTLLK